VAVVHSSKWIAICGNRREGFVPLAEFTEELNKITVNAEPVTEPDGSPPADMGDRILLRRELLELIYRAHGRRQPAVRDEECDVVRDGDVVAALKYPRPGHLYGWHYRLYTGLPDSPDDQLLVWLLASRKADRDFSSTWDSEQTEHINTAHGRFKSWIVTRITQRL
jgi:hypothetical protein